MEIVKWKEIKMGSVDVEGMGRAIRCVFDDCQDGSVAMSKSVNKFCKILNKVSWIFGDVRHFVFRRVKFHQYTIDADQSK